jgi:hypothetical protein
MRTRREVMVSFSVGISLRVIALESWEGWTRMRQKQRPTKKTENIAMKSKWNEVVAR